MSVREKLAKRASRAGLTLSKGLLEGLEAYFELLRKWNRKLSLTALPVEEPGDEAVDRLLIEPVLASKFLPQGGAQVIDIGSGGGSPAVPMKLAAPGIALRMVESKTRKAAFLREVLRSLDLHDTVVEAVRVEELLVRPALHDSADVVTMRAVRVDAKMLAGLQSFIKPGGQLFLFGTEGGAAAVSMPQLVFKQNHTLLHQWGSRLEVFEKSAR